MQIDTVLRLVKMTTCAFLRRQLVRTKRLSKRLAALSILMALN